MALRGLGTKARSGEKSLGNRGFSVKAACMIVGLIAVAPVMSGCELFGGWGEPKVEFNGRPATAAEIRAEADAAAKRAAADAEIAARKAALEAETAATKAAESAKAQADTMAANLRAEADAAKTEQARRKAEFDKATATLDADTRIRLASLQAEYEIATQETASRIERMAVDTEKAVATVNAGAAAKIDAAKASAAAKIAEAQADAQARIDGVKASADAGLAKIAEIAERREALLSGGSSAARLVPGYGELISGAILGLGGFAWGARGKKKAADDSWDEATTAANAARDKADTLYDEGKRESELGKVLAALLRVSVPPPTPPGNSAESAKA